MNRITYLATAALASTFGCSLGAADESYEGRNDGAEVLSAPDDIAKRVKTFYDTKWRGKYVMAAVYQLVWKGSAAYVYYGYARADAPETVVGHDSRTFTFNGRDVTMGGRRSGASLAPIGRQRRCPTRFDKKYKCDFPGVLDYEFKTVKGQEAVHVRLIIDEGWVDNSYGLNTSEGYPFRREPGAEKLSPARHKFKDLVGSDSARLIFKDDKNQSVLDAKLDYISEDSNAPSGYASLGVSNGEGKLETGNSHHILHVSTSLSDNFNQLGCVFTEDSPTEKQCPLWENRVIYEVSIALDAFGPSRWLGSVSVESLHASPPRRAEVCDNGVDDEDDANQLVDCEDPYCAMDPVCSGPVCYNGVDEDLDNAVDCADSDCANYFLCKMLGEVPSPRGRP